MTKDDRDRAEARFNKAAKAADEGKSSRSDRDAAAKAVIDNMARLKALRLAREAAEPARTVVAKKKSAPKSGAKSGKSSAKTPALGEWLASQVNGGRRT
ncbi:hypothetical protein HNR60_000175 [Rhodopseudomonas rhenobacensis]|uniref:Uncharacterized protein n=1 Tax=Rhodopseudomonas rhenobacensis TaxID=87461 RepID=A0A7W7YZZ8_9BRAD|nr:hypothetical protein [Rhodopseudomonas rhenobacensis]MBB5045446.1 hypothetical protein [Rhodopseudomonas rhenobacensis]